MAGHPVAAVSGSLRGQEAPMWEADRSARVIPVKGRTRQKQRESTMTSSFAGRLAGAHDWLGWGELKWRTFG
jgi:hypothetical protein